MPDISKIKYNGTSYDIKDAVARETIAGAIKILGATTTALTDESTTNPITVNGESVTAVQNDAVFYNSKEFVFDGTMWHEFGDMTGLGDMAEHDLSDVEFTTTVSQATAETTVSQATAETTIATSSDVTTTVSAAQSGDATYTPTVTRTTDVAVGVATNETWDNVSVSYGGTTGTDAETLVISTASKTAAKTIEVTTQPAFTGTGVRLVTGNISVPATFTTTVSAQTAETTVSAQTAETTADYES